MEYSLVKIVPGEIAASPETADLDETDSAIRAQLWIARTSRWIAPLTLNGS